MLYNYITSLGQIQVIVLHCSPQKVAHSYTGIPGYSNPEREDITSGVCGILKRLTSSNLSLFNP